MAAAKTSPKESAYRWLYLALVFAGLVLATLWSWHKWNQVWVQRSADFFPPEWKQAMDTSELAWQYPLYRSNDSYQWVHLADSLAAGDTGVLHWRSDEGPPEGRANIWHSGLARLLHLSGWLNAQWHDWTVVRGIHEAAHWIGSVVLLILCAFCMLLLLKTDKAWSAAFFAVLLFFNAGSAWDFAFSRLDHEAMFQSFFTLQLIGLYALLRHRNIGWTLLASLGSAGCWWVSATTQAAIGILITTALILAAYLNRSGNDEANKRMATACLGWGLLSSAGILVLGLLDGRMQWSASIASLHPVFILAQAGSGMVAAAAFMAGNSKRRTVYFSIGLLAGLTPLIWIGLHGQASHIWFDPFARRIHDSIVEFQSPWMNGIWKSSLFLHPMLLSLAACLAAIPVFQSPKEIRPGYVLLLGLILLACMQTRWLGLLATAACLQLALTLSSGRSGRILGLVLCSLCLLGWLRDWSRIETKPGREFVADMILQTGSRDLNLNLQSYSKEQAVRVAMPYAFAASPALVPAIHPIGSFYWENTDGLRLASELFSAQSDNEAWAAVRQAEADYLVVQGDVQDGPFEALVTWAARAETDSAGTSFAHRLANGQLLPGWLQELPYYGTFPKERIRFRIYRVIKTPETAP